MDWNIKDPAFSSFYTLTHITLQVANPDVAETVKGADILIFVLPHQFVKPTCKQMEGHVKKGALAVSLIKVHNSY